LAAIINVEPSDTVHKIYKQQMHNVELVDNK